MMVWKMYLLSNMAVLGSYVRFHGCKVNIPYMEHMATHVFFKHPILTEYDQTWFSLLTCQPLIDEIVGI